MQREGHPESEARLKLTELEALVTEKNNLLRELERKALLKEALFYMSMQLHSWNDADGVLTDLIRFLEELVPGKAFEIYVSQDHYSSLSSVRPLRFQQSEDDLRYRAFVEGRPLVSEAGADRIQEAAFPLRGKQGVYGILRCSTEDEPLSPETLQNVTLLADTAGGAFENAKLYEQANRYVDELRLINEMSQRLNQSLTPQHIYQFASKELRHIFDAEFSCIVELDKTDGRLVVRASEPASFFNEQYEADYGFSGKVMASKEPVIISDFEADPIVRSVWMEKTNSRSLLACPILMDDTAVGVIMVAHRRPNYFSYEKYRLLQTLSGHIGLAISNACLHAEVRRMVQTDRLTGLYARHYLDDHIGMLQKRDPRGSLIVVDIDNFKLVNDTYGHQAGDEVLVKISAITRACVREGDIPSRWGGEELAVYLPGATKEQAEQVAERIRRRVFSETNPQTTVSCGISEWRREDDKISVESLFYRADMALYKAKHEGKNRICIG